MRKAILIMAAGSAIASAAHAETRFDLVCSGTEKAQRSGRLTSSPYHLRYSVDLDARKWCAQPCAGPSDIVRVGDKELVLQDSSDNGPDSIHSSKFTIHRFTGGLEKAHVQFIPGILDRRITVKGVCTKSAFTDFPKPKF